MDGEWYITAFCLERDNYRHFALSRIRAASDTKEEFEPPEDFNPDAYYSNRFSKFLGPEDSQTTRVTVRFTPKAAEWVLEREWHPEQKIVREKNGALRLTLPMPSLFEAKKWILGWGAEAEVTAPAALRREMARETRAMHLRYG